MKSRAITTAYQVEVVYTDGVPVLPDRKNPGAVMHLDAMAECVPGILARMNYAKDAEIRADLEDLIKEALSDGGASSPSIYSVESCMEGVRRYVKQMLPDSGDAGAGEIRFRISDVRPR